jgi:predicted ribosomally synthesized peptide with nif11-like leader
MRSVELERLMRDLQHESGLREEFHRIGKDPEQAVRHAAAKGYRLTRHDAEELVRSFEELSDEDLDKAAGGAWNDPPPPPTSPTGGTGG